jgi:hypothetical protein
LSSFSPMVIATGRPSSCHRRRWSASTVWNACRRPVVVGVIIVVVVVLPFTFTSPSLHFRRRLTRLSH